MLVEHTDPQGTEAWLESRRGVITASRAKDARDRKKNGDPSEKMLGYAMDLARERVGGKAPQVYANAAMRTGTEEEPFARIAYMAKTGQDVREVGFFTTEDCLFGMSPDGLVGEHGMVEIKTMVSSQTMFRAMVHGDITDYLDQCLFGLWMFGLRWVDLCLWAHDLQHLEVIRIARSEDEIQRLEDDLLAFEKLVREFEGDLQKKLNAPAEQSSLMDSISEPAPAPRPPAPNPPAALTPAKADPLPADIFA
jgi:exodeoxyribonuclease (lambda-induced)